MTPANPLVLQDGHKYLLFVSTIKDKNKAIPRNGHPGLWHIFTALLVNKKTGEEIVGEFVTQDKENHSVTPGVSQWFKVEYVSRLGTPTIVSCEPEEGGVRYENNDRVNTGTIHTEPEAGRNTYATILSGTAIAFAYAYAKDLLVAEIGLRPVGSAVTEDDLIKMCQFGDSIAVSMAERISF